MLWDLFIAFFRVGIFGFGGGPSVMPLVKKEVVDRYGWMSNDEFANVLAVGNTLPGPIATKMAGYIGYRMAGITGCVLSVIATSIPVAIAMVALLTTFTLYKEEPWVRGLGLAVVPVVAVMLGQLTWEFFAKSGKTIKIPVLLVASAAITGLLVLLELHPAILICGLILAALLWPVKSAANKGQNNK